MKISNLKFRGTEDLTLGSSLSTHDQISSRSHKISVLIPKFLLKSKYKVVAGFYSDNLLTTHENQRFEAHKLYYKGSSNPSISPQDVEINFLNHDEDKKDHNQLKQFLKKFLNSFLNMSYLQNVTIRIPDYSMENYGKILSAGSLKNFDKVKGLSFHVIPSLIEKINFKHLPSLETLELKRASLLFKIPNMESFLVSISHLSNLKEIKLINDSSEFKINGLTCILHKNPKLQSIHFKFDAIRTRAFDFERFQEAIQELNLLKILSLHINKLVFDDKRISDVQIFNQIVQSFSKNNLQFLDLNLPDKSLPSSETQTDLLNIKGLLNSTSIRTLTLYTSIESIETRLLDYISLPFEFFSIGIESFTMKILSKGSIFPQNKAQSKHFSKEYQIALSILQWMPNLKNLIINSYEISLSLETIAEQIKTLKYLVSFELTADYRDTSKENFNSEFSSLTNSLQGLNRLSSLELDLKGSDLSYENVEKFSNCLKSLEELTVCRLRLYHQDNDLFVAKVLESFSIRSNKLKNFEMEWGKKIKINTSPLITLCNFLSKSSSLEVLKISKFRFAVDQKEDLIKLHQSSSILKKMKEVQIEFDFRDKCINPTYSKHEILCDTICNLQNLSKIKLDFGKIEDLSDLFLSLVSRIPRLKYLRELGIIANSHEINLEKILMDFVQNLQFTSKIIAFRIIITTREEQNLDEFCREIMRMYPNLKISCQKVS